MVEVVKVGKPEMVDEPLGLGLARREVVDEDSHQHLQGFLFYLLFHVLI